MKISYCVLSAILFYELLFTFELYAEILRTGTDYKANFGVVNKGRLEWHCILMEWRGVSLEECWYKCIQHLRCESVSYNKEQNLCQLNDIEFDEDEGDVHAVGWFNYGTLPLPPPPVEFIPTCLDKETTLNNYDKGYAWYFDRHDIKCQDGHGLTSFKLIYVKADRDPVKNSKIQYVYTCCSLPVTSCTNSKQIDSPQTDEKKGEIRELKEHPVKCEKGVMKGFKYSRGPDTKPRKFFYRFWCCYPYIIPVCYDDATAVQMMKGQNTDNLAHHDVVCQKGYTLGSFQLQHKIEGNNELINYKFTCCKVFSVA